MYDITEKESFDHIVTWQDHFMSKSQPENAHKIPFLILGNKSDMAAEAREIPREQAEHFCKSRDNTLFFETSAKDSTNVSEAFYALAQVAVRVQKEIAAQEMEKS